MKCTKDFLIPLGLLVTVILTIGGMGLNQLTLLQAEQEKDDQTVKQEISQIRQDIQIIRADIKQILRELP